METLIALLGGFVAVAAVLAAIAIWSPRRLSWRVLAVATVALLMPISYLAMNQLLGQPKPLAKAWLESASRQATVLGIRTVENDAIYLWLQLDETPAPQSFRLDWDTGLAQRLQDLAEEAAELDGVIRMENPFAFSSMRDLGKLNMNVEIAPPPPRKALPPEVVVPDPRETQI